MKTVTLTDYLRSLRLHLAHHAFAGLDTRQLLSRFVSEGDDAAFACVVKRHGPLVLAVCRRVLGNEQEAEDAFQATFLVLLKRAHAIRKQESLASWLHGVAYRIAVKAARRAARRQQAERKAVRDMNKPEVDAVAVSELRQILDEEIERLPRSFRQPLILCCLQEKTHAEAAKELRLPRSTVTAHLAQAKELLSKRLVRRGVEVSPLVLGAALVENTASAMLPPSLLVNTVQLASAVLTAKASKATAAVALAQAFLRGLLAAKLAMGAVVVSLAALGSVGAYSVGILPGGSPLSVAHASTGHGVPPNVDPKLDFKAQPPAKKTANNKSEAAGAPLLDWYGDPLPPGAVARLGTERFRTPSPRTLAYSPDGTMLATVSALGDETARVCIWDAKTGKSLHRFVVKDNGHLLAFSPDSKTVITESGMVNLSTKEVQVIAGPQKWLLSMACSPDGKTMARAEFVGTKMTELRITLIDVATGKEVRHFSWEGGNVQDGPGRVGPPTLVFSPDGKTIAMGSADKTVRLWDVQTGKEIRRLEGQEVASVWVTFSPTGKLVASSGAGGKAVFLWDSDTGKLLNRIKVDGQFVAIAFCPDGTLFASEDTTLRVFDIQNGNELRRWNLPYRMSSFAFSPDGKTIAASGGVRKSFIHRWEISTGKEIDPPEGHTGEISALHFAPNGNKLFSISSDRLVYEWSLAATENRVHRLGGPLGRVADSRFAMSLDLSATGRIAALHFAPLAKEQPTLEVYDVLSGRQLHALPTNPNGRQRKMSPDGKFLADLFNGKIVLWDLATGKTVQRFTAGQTFAFSPNSKWLAIAGDFTVRVYNVETGQMLRTWDHRLGSVNELAFSADGKMLAYFDFAQNTTVGVWAVDSGKQILALSLDGQRYISALGLSPSGRYLVAIDDEAIHIGETLSGETIRAIRPDQGRISAIAFSPDGRTLATGGADSTILVWDLTGRANGNLAIRDPLTPAELEKLWSDLASGAAKADAALWAFALSGKQGASLLAARLRPAEPADAKKVAALLADLESDKFSVRTSAAKELDNLGEAAEGQLRRALTTQITLELRQRVEQILQKRDSGSEILRRLRAIEALEQSSDPEAKRTLELVAERSPQPRLVEAAKAALGRLGGRTGKGP